MIAIHTRGNFVATFTISLAIVDHESLTGVAGHGKTCEPYLTNPVNEARTLTVGDEVIRDPSKRPFQSRPWQCRLGLSVSHDFCLATRTGDNPCSTRTRCTHTSAASRQ